MKNIDKLRDYLKSYHFDGILLRTRKNFSWITNGRRNYIVLSEPIGVVDILVTHDNVYVITTKMEEKRLLDEELKYFPFNAELLAAEWFEGTDGIIQELGKNKRMASDVPYLDWTVIDGELRLIRSVLTKEERSRYRLVCQDAGRAIEEVCRELKPKMSEYEIAGLLEFKCSRLGINTHVGLVATDERIFNYRHPIPTKKRLEKYAMVVLCGERGGLIANCTRFVCFGELPDFVKDNKEKVLVIESKMIEQTKFGNKVSDVVKTCIEQYKKFEFENDWRYLHLGGVTGYMTREYLATPASTDSILLNQAFAWNPSLPGITTEDTFLVTENGPEVMTLTETWPSIDINGLSRPDILIK